VISRELIAVIALPNVINSVSSLIVYVHSTEQQRVIFVVFQYNCDRCK